MRDIGLDRLAAENRELKSQLEAWKMTAMIDRNVETSVPMVAFKLGDRIHRVAINQTAIDYYPDDQLIELVIQEIAKNLFYERIADAVVPVLRRSLTYLRSEK